MKRSIRHSLRWSLVVTLATFLGTGPVAAGWLHRHLHGCPAEPVCAPAPTCCEPQPEPVCCGEPVYSPPVVDCCEPAPCCGDEIVTDASSAVDSSVWGETVLQESDAEIVAPPAADTQQVHEHEHDAENTDHSDDTPPDPTSVSDPVAIEQDDASDTADTRDQDSSSAAEVEPAEPATMPEPEVVPEPIADESADDLFGGASDAEMNLPADPEPVIPEPAVPEPVSPPAEPAVDDLFGGTNEGEMTEPALDALPPATEPTESESIDDLFGAPADALAPPAESPAAPAEAESVDDLFGGDADAFAPDPAMPAEDLPATGDDLFGDPSGFDSLPAEDSSGGIDDLFSDPAGQPDMTEPALPETPAEGVDDLFSEPPADDSSEGALDDLFSLWNADADAGEQNAASDLVEAFEAQPEAQQTAVVPQSADTLIGLDNTESRTWVDNTGGFRTEGRLIKIGDDHVKLLKNNGKTCTVPKSRLSDADSDYVQSIAHRVALFVMATPGR